MPYFFNINVFNKSEAEEGQSRGIHRLKIQKTKSGSPFF